MPRKTNPLSPIGTQINTVRMQKNMSLGQLTKDARLDYSQLYRIMHGSSHPSYESLLRICRALQCTPEEAGEIFGQTNYRTPDPGELEEELAA